MSKEISLKECFNKILYFIEENPKREGLDSRKILNGFRKIFRKFSSDNNFNLLSEENYTSNDDLKIDGLITVKNIDFVSMDESNFLPFYGTISIGYIPNRNIIELNALDNLITQSSTFLQNQYNFQKNVADLIFKLAGTSFVIVYCKAKHFIINDKGLSKKRIEKITYCYMCEPRFDNVAYIDEFLQIIEK